jgi:hypothetical protein
VVLIPAVATRRWSNAHMGDLGTTITSQAAAPSSLVEGCSSQGCAHYGWRGEVLIDEIREFVPKFKVCIFA